MRCSRWIGACVPEAVVTAGSAWWRATDRPAAGSVIASLARAAYVDVAGHVLALVTRAAPPGPLHASVDRLPRLRVGERVEIEPGTVRVGSATWSLATATHWRAPAVDGVRLATFGPQGAAALTIADRSVLAGEPLRGLLTAGCDVAVPALCGRGPGLTPAGDDVVAGMFLVRALTGCDRSEMVAHARAAPTHPIGRAFLAAAASGECIEPAHRLLGALADRDAAAVDRWQDVLAGVGASSGCDLVLGMKVALQNGRSASQTACAGFLPGFDQKWGRSVRKWSASPALNV
jgi:hypothetical protein